MDSNSLEEQIREHRDKALADQEADHERRIAQIRAGHEQRIADFEARIEKYFNLMKEFQSALGLSREDCNRLMQDNARLQAELQQSKEMYNQLLKVVQSAISSQESNKKTS